MIKISPNDPCPCYSGRKYKKCCRPYHAGRPAPSPEALMRSRFSAYALGDVEYIIQTTHPDSDYYVENKVQWRAQIRAFIINCDFRGLEVEAKGDDWVYFRSKIDQGDTSYDIEEHSRFQQLDGRWLYFAPDPVDDD